MPGDFDAIVIGAGPAGSTAAILLARAGWSVALVEKQRFPRRKVCGECIAASNLPLLHALGLGGRFDAEAGPALRRLALMRGDRTVLAALPGARYTAPQGAPPEAHRWGRALGRETLDAMLLDQARAAGAQVLQPWSAQAVEGAAGDFRCQVRALDSQASAVLRAPVAIAAHGSWEALPSGRPQRRQARAASDLFAFKANFRDAALAEGLLAVLSFDGGYGGMVIADGGLATLACCVRRDRLDACRRAAPGLRAGEVAEALLARECAGVHAALQGARREGPWLASGPLDPGVRLDAGDGLLRIGNAAGEAHPIVGEGMSMAMQSAWLLCARLLEDGARAAPPDAAWQHALARRYAADWQRHFSTRLRLAAAFAHLAMRPVAAPLMALLRHAPAVLTLGAEWAGKTRCAVDPATIVRIAGAGTAAGTPASSSFASHALHAPAQGRPMDTT